MSNPDDPAAWMAKAANDLLCIDNNLDNERIPWDTVCFHAQQAAEKAPKAALVSRRMTPARTHDLAALLGECVSVGLELNGLLADCNPLSAYAAASRYPGAAPEPTEVEGHGAVEASRRVMQAVQRLFS